MMISAISRSKRVAITDDGIECPFTNTFDRFGEECDDASEAIIAICQLPNGDWATVDLTQFVPVAVH
jgi:hypothetical protein